MSAGNAVFVEALGLALVPLGDSLPAVRRQLAGKPVRLVRDQGADLLAQFPELVSALACAAVVNAAGGELLTANATACVIADGCIGETVTAEVEGVHLPLCWHHDNEHRNGQLPIRLADVAGWLAQLVLQRVAGWCGVAAADLTARDLSWWATVYKVLPSLPDPLLRSACRLAPIEPDRKWSPRGNRETDARYRDHRLEVAERDPLADLRARINAKPAIRQIDPEPAALYLGKPKRQRWECAAYLAFVRQLPCVVTGQRKGIEAHHVVGHGMSVMGSKAHDLMVFPLAHQPHMELHRIGWKAWEVQHGSQLEHVINTLELACSLGVFNAKS
ncbi:DUF968 domain-containing protein [Aeromonas bestiarum]|uniref:DUF968 domain-containing protein n=1 Tax=Aeromonas bestiarum TaxID=105751 RepID=UPI003671524E